MLNLEIQCQTALLRSSRRTRSPSADLKEIIEFLEMEQLPYDHKTARKITLQASLFTIDDQVIYYIDPKQKHQKRVVVPSHLQEQILLENHSSGMAGHFSGNTCRTYGALVRHWWWDGMHANAMRFV